jgi:hypothetical protein
MQRTDLENAGIDGLERIYREAPVGPLPIGNFRGRFLGWLDTPGSKRWHVRAADWLLFEKPRFGVDFDRRVWWFVKPSLAAGRFEVSHGPSRWRPCDTLRLTYETSRLPAAIRNLLYDEVKPLGADLLLGLGGTNFDTGEGDHFFFSLSRY